MKKGKFANGPAEPRRIDVPPVDLPEALIVELSYLFASWADVDLSEVVEADKHRCDESESDGVTE